MVLGVPQQLMAVIHKGIFVSLLGLGVRSRRTLFFRLHTIRACLARSRPEMLQSCASVLSPVPAVQYNVDLCQIVDPVRRYPCHG